MCVLSFVLQSRILFRHVLCTNLFLCFYPRFGGSDIKGFGPRDDGDDDIDGVNLVGIVSIIDGGNDFGPSEIDGKVDSAEVSLSVGKVGPFKEGDVGITVNEGCKLGWIKTTLENGVGENVSSKEGAVDVLDGKPGTSDENGVGGGVSQGGGVGCAVGCTVDFTVDCALGCIVGCKVGFTADRTLVGCTVGCKVG